MKVYGDVGNEGAFTIPTYDRGFASFCYKDYNNPNPNVDMLLVKMDSVGDTLWTKIFKGPNGCVGPWDFTQAQDSGFILTGTVRDSSFVQPNQSVVIRTDKNGDTLWTKGGLGPGYAISTIDGGFALYSNFEISKFGSNGNLQWKKYYSNIGSGAQRFQQTNDGGFIMYGETNTYSTGGPSDRDIYLLKIDSLGGVVWERAYGGLQYETAGMVIETFAGDFVVIGVTQSFGVGDSDILLMKINSGGDTLWVETLGGPYTEFIGCVQQTFGSLGYILTGATCGFSISDDTAAIGNYRGYLIKTDYNGNFMWARRYGKGPNDNGKRVFPTTDNGFVYSGFTGGWGQGQTDAWIVKTDALGECGCYSYLTTPLITKPTLNISQGGSTVINSTVTPYNVNVLVNKNTQTIPMDICPVGPSGMSELSKGNMISIFPNPNSGDFILKVDEKYLNSEFQIFNFLGEQLFSGKLDKLENDIEMRTFSCGCYVIRLISSTAGCLSVRVIKE